MAAQRALNPKVEGSTPSSPTNSLSGAAAGNYRVTERDRELFAREWNRGTPTKLIAAMLEPPRSPGALRSWRIQMGLPRRQRPNGFRHGDGVTRICFELPVAFRDAMGRRAHELRLTVPAYLRLLIRNDLSRR